MAETRLRSNIVEQNKFRISFTQLLNFKTHTENNLDLSLDLPIKGRCSPQNRF